MDDYNEYECFNDSLTISTRGEYSGTVTYHEGKFLLANNILVMEMAGLSRNQKIFIGSLINKLNYGGYSGYPRKETLKKDVIELPKRNNQIDFEFMDTFIAELEAERIAELSAYLKVSGLDNYELSVEELKALQDYENVEVKEFEYQEIFEKIAQGRRLKKSDQIDGNIPFVMSGVTNTGIVNYVSNPVVMFPKNSITLDIFGNAFYRPYDFGAGDDTGVYWNENNIFNRESMLFITTSMRTSVLGKYDYGKKLRSSQSNHIKLALPVKNGKPDIDYMEIFTKAIIKLVIKDVVRYADERIDATKQIVEKHNAIQN